MYNISKLLKVLFVIWACLCPSLAHATFFVAGFSSDYGVVAIDSRMLRGSVTSDRYCKIRPLSKNALFFARGSTSEFDDDANKEVFDARDIARSVYAKLGTGNPNFPELARAWAVQMVGFYNKRPLDFSRSAVDGLMTDGFFVGTNARGDVQFSGQSIRYQSRGASHFVGTSEPVVFSDPAVQPKYVSGYHEIIKEFRNGGRTERARKVLSHLDTAQRGPDAVAARYSALVRAVRDWTGDKGIGGDVATIIVERDKGWRWFHRPDYCPQD